MRIRKHAKSSSLSFFGAPISPYLGPKSQEHVCCELNQSPWDVMSFVPEFDLYPPNHYQAEGEDIVSGYGSRGESLGTFESGLSSLKESSQYKEKERNINSSSASSLSMDLCAQKGENETVTGNKGGLICCNKTDGKGWKCRKEAKEGHLLCEHHLIQLKSYKHKYAGKKSRSVEVETKKRLPDHIKRSSSNSSPDFYYYTGFGPLWGSRRGEAKKRGTKEVEEMEAEANAETGSHTTLSSPSHNDHPLNGNDDDDNSAVLVDADDDDDDDDEVIMKKRARKPIKTRSLKSLL